MTSEPLSLRIEVALPDDADAEELDDATRALRAELLELDVAAVDQPTQPAPPGARAVDAALLGTLIVGVGRGALSAVTGMLERWVARAGDRRVVLELDGDRLEVSGVSAADQRQLIEAFVARHGGGEQWRAGTP